MPRPPSSVRSNQGTKARKTKDLSVSEDINAPEANESAISQELPANQPGSVKAGTLISSNSDAAGKTGQTRRGRRTSGQGVENPVLAIQPPLFTVTARGDVQQPDAEIPPLTPESSLEAARWWFRSYLEQMNRPRNTVASYMYDLAGFEEFAAKKALVDINRDDVNAFLTQSQKKSTRKRRLTSLGAFFKYLINTEKILDKDPTDNFFAEFIPLKTPVVLDAQEQAAILVSAAEENIRTYLMVYFMLKLGFTRTELLAIQPEHVDVADPENPQVYVFYDDKRWHKKERRLAAAPEFSASYQQYLAEFSPSRKLFEMLPQSVNKLVERVARNADINKKVTPQSLRDTFGVEEARSGANSTRLLMIMGLAPDPRNRMSVERYIKLATPPVI